MQICSPVITLTHFKTGILYFFTLDCDNSMSCNSNPKYLENIRKTETKKRISNILRPKLDSQRGSFCWERRRLVFYMHTCVYLNITYRLWKITVRKRKKLICPSHSLRITYKPRNHRIPKWLTEPTSPLALHIPVHAGCHAPEENTKYLL